MATPFALNQASTDARSNAGVFSCTIDIFAARVTLSSAPLFAV
ncbi:hypothetical protein DP23_4076 [Ralstonia pickettii]|nr:hypothetical protein DP23_4076 [Ralstonia pickettii]